MFETARLSMAPVAGSGLCRSDADGDRRAGRGAERGRLAGVLRGEARHTEDRYAGHLGRRRRPGRCGPSRRLQTVRRSDQGQRHVDPRGRLGGRDARQGEEGSHRVSVGRRRVRHLRRRYEHVGLVRASSRRAAARRSSRRRSKTKPTRTGGTSCRTSSTRCAIGASARTAVSKRNASAPRTASGNGSPRSG